MRSSSVVLVAMAVLSLDVNGQPGHNTNEEQAKKFLEMFNAEAQVVYFKAMEDMWIYNTNVTEYNQKRMVQSDLEYNLFRQNMSRMAAEFNVDGFSADFKRQFAKIKDIGLAATPDVKKLEELNNATAEMTNIYNTARFCLTENECLPLYPDIASKLASSRDEPLLRKLWVGWNDVTGKKMKSLYARFVTLSNEAVQALDFLQPVVPDYRQLIAEQNKSIPSCFYPNYTDTAEQTNLYATKDPYKGYKDMGAYWRSGYEMNTFENDIANVFKELRPFYEQLHAYVRRRLKAQYGAQIFPISGQIPAHLLGDMLTIGWNSLRDLLLPYPNKSAQSVTKEMVRQNYTAVKMYQEAEKFFTSLGLTPMPPEFWNKSMLEKPKDGREVMCHPTAWDFFNGVDFRVTDCPVVVMGYLSTVYNVMGHVEYYLQYKHQPVIYRYGANPVIVSSSNTSDEDNPPSSMSSVDRLQAFHEAIADVFTLSVDTTKHLHKIGLLPVLIEDKDDILHVARMFILVSDFELTNYNESVTFTAPIAGAIMEDEFSKETEIESDLNSMMANAMFFISIMPFNYLADLWRWNVFKGKTTPANYNKAWWALRCDLQGVSPPVRRTENDFDAGADFQIPSNTPYMKYFVSLVLQFQIHKALCNVAGHTGPLHQCDIYQSKAAGAMLRKVLRTGSSQVWTKPFKTMTNQTRMSAKPLIEYFQPVMDYLKEINGEDVGWEKNCSTKTFLN